MAMFLKRHARTLAISAALILAAGTAQAAAKIDHKPPKSAASGKDLTIKASITAGGEVVQPYIAYRAGSSGEFQTVPLQHGSGKDFSGVVPGSAISGDVLQYYIGAYDGSDLSEGTWKSKNSPQKLKLGAAEKAEKPAKEAKPEKEAKSEKEAKPEKEAKAEKEEKPAKETKAEKEEKPSKASRHHHGKSEEAEAEKIEEKPEVKVEAKPAPKPEPKSVAKKEEEEKPVPPPEEPKPAPAPVKPAPAPVKVAEAAKPAPPPTPPPPPAASGAFADLPPITGSDKPPSYAPILSKSASESALPTPKGLPEGQGYIKIITDPPGALINFDGTDVGNAPIEQTTAEGNYIVDAKMEGFRKASTVVQIVAGSGKQLHLTLKPK